MQLAKKKHVPMRTCVSCGKKTTKRDLLRIVATTTDGVVIDSSGRVNGRGTYVCRDGTCGSEGLQRGRVEHVLRIKLTDENWNTLTNSITQTVKVSD